MTPRHVLPAVIRTERLTLRAPVMTDLADLVAMANNSKMVETTATLPFPYAESDGLDFIQQAVTSATLRAYAIAGMDDRLMGAILFKFADGKLPEVGYWLGEPHWGKGYAAEAVRGLLEAVRHLPAFVQVHARVLESNPASIRVLEKAGFSIIERSLSVVERHRGKPLLIMTWSAS